MKLFIALLRKSLSSWLDNNASSLSAALAFYTIFSLVPLLVIVIGVTGLIFNQQDTENQIFSEVAGIIGVQGADFVREVAQSTGPRDTNVMAVVIGAVVLLFGAAGVFNQLQYSLDIIWKTPLKEKQGWLKTLRNKLLSFGGVLIIGFLFLVSVLTSTALGAAGSYVFNESVRFLQILNIGVSFIVSAVLFMLMYHFMPNVKVSLKDSLVGGVFTALLFIIGRLVIGLILGAGTTAANFGPAASLVLILLWIYYSAHIFYFGAEFTYAYSKRPGGLLQRLKNFSIHQ